MVGSVVGAVCLSTRYYSCRVNMLPQHCMHTQERRQSQEEISTQPWIPFGGMPWCPLIAPGSGHGLAWCTATELCKCQHCPQVVRSWSAAIRSLTRPTLNTCVKMWNRVPMLHHPVLCSGAVAPSRLFSVVIERCTCLGPDQAQAML